jgi:hypothetical protein
MERSSRRSYSYLTVGLVGYTTGIIASLVRHSRVITVTSSRNDQNGRNDDDIDDRDDENDDHDAFHPPQVSSRTFHAAQPALLYLVPCVLGPIALKALRAGQLEQLWTGFGDDAMITPPLPPGTQHHEGGVRA